MNKMIAGMASGAYEKSGPNRRYWPVNALTRPMIMPPANAQGRLLSWAMAAAANAMTMSRVRFSTTMPVSGAMRMPATPAVMQPRAQEAPLMTFGLVPLSPASVRLSTTARIATPVRER